MKVTRRTALAGMGAGALGAVIAAACGQATMTPEEAPKTEMKEEAPKAEATAMPEVETATISMISAEKPTTRPVLEPILADFTEQMPHIAVDLVPSGGWGEVRTKFYAAQAAGDPINIMENGWSAVLTTFETGVTIDLAPFFTRDKIDPEATFAAPAIGMWTVEGKILGMPITMSVDAMAYNVDLFEANGINPLPVDLDDTDWNMEAFLDLATKLTNDDRTQFGHGGGITCSNGGGIGTGTYWGAGPWDSAAGRATIDTPEFIDALDWWRDFGSSHRVTPNAEEREGAMGGQSGNVFMSGKVAMQLTCTSFRDAPFTWALATMPYSGEGPSQSGRTWTHPLQMADDGADNNDLAWELFKWLLRPENGGRYPPSAGHVVSPLLDDNASTLAQEGYKNSLGVDPRSFLLHSRTTKPAGWGLWTFTEFGDISGDINGQYREFLAGNLTGAEYARWAADLINATLGDK
jgi:ABC-type glycerol-3-phosphate transport system substrate-binding protein